MKLLHRVICGSVLVDYRYTSVLCHLSSISSVIDCGSLDDPNNGQVELSNTTFRSTANFTCSQGYSLSNGNSIRTCEANGEWSGDSPICECMS